MISIQGLDRAAVLAALYNASTPLGMGFMQYDPAPMTVEDAQELQAHHTHFDYLKGRVLKASFNSERLDEVEYDARLGSGMMKRVIDTLRRTGEVNNAALADRAANMTANAALDAQRKMEEPPPPTVRGSNFAVITMTLADTKPALGPKVEEAIKSLSQRRA